MRLLLLEFFPDALRRNEKSMLFPFVKGFARHAGAKTLWLCFGGAFRVSRDVVAARRGPPELERGRTRPEDPLEAFEDERRARWRSIHAELDDADRRTLGLHLELFRPTHVLTSEVLSAGLRALVAARAPGAKVLVAPIDKELHPLAPVPGLESLADRTERAQLELNHADWIARWLGLDDAPWRGRMFLDIAPPDYAALLCNEAAYQARTNLVLSGGVPCGYERLIRSNPCYADVDIGDAHRAAGCTFCMRGGASAPVSEDPDDLAVAERQLRALVETAGASGRNRGSLDVVNVRLFLQFDRFFERVLRLGMPPTVFYFAPRIDFVLSTRARIEKVLPDLAAAGHEVRFLSMGIENFSEAENLRFNKGISVAQVDEFLALVHRWSDQFPGVLRPFKAGGESVELGTILFTPWTRLADVRINYEAGRARGFPGMGYWLHSTLLLRKHSAITALARHDGDLLVDAFPDRAQLFGNVANQDDPGDALAWRFREPKTADLFALMVRLSAAAREGPGCAFFAQDPEFPEVARLYREAFVAEVSPLEVGLELLGRMEREERGRPRLELLREAVGALVAQAEARRRAAAGPAPVPRDDAPPPPAGPQSLMPPPPTVGESPEAAELRRFFDELRAAPRAPLEGLEPLSVRQVDVGSRRALQLELGLAGRRVVLELLDDASDEPCFFRTARFKVAHSPDTPVRNFAERDRLKALVELAERRLAQAGLAGPAAA